MNIICYLKLPGLSSNTLKADLKSSKGPPLMLLLLLFVTPELLVDVLPRCPPPNWLWVEVVALVLIDEDLLLYAEWFSDFRVPFPEFSKSSPLPLPLPTPDNSESVIGWSPLYASKFPLPLEVPPISYFNIRHLYVQDFDIRKIYKEIEK